MKFCPKCRSFYDDAGLAFCLADGIPLVEINQSNALWAEGNEAVSTSRRIIENQTRRQKLKRISRILITTVMIILVISVIAMNIYLNFPTNEDEKAKNITPSPTKEMPVIVEATPSPTSRATATPTPKTKSSLIDEDDEEDDKKDDDKDDQPQCSKYDEESIRTIISGKYFAQWQTAVTKKSEAGRKEFANKNNAPVERTKSERTSQSEKIKVLEKCKKATVEFTYSFRFEATVRDEATGVIRTKVENFPVNMTSACTSITATNWQCSPIN